MKEWEDAANELDDLEGNHEWKIDSAGNYRSDQIKAKLEELDQARINCDIPVMLHLMRTAFDRELGGMGKKDLYRHSYAGTKTLIERYVESAIETINALVEKSAYACPPHLEQRDLLSGALYARQSFGRSALLLSGGATFGMAHIGVIKAIFEANLLPRIISGASAGSIVCSVLCTRTDEEIPAVMNEFPYGDLAVFEEEGQGDGIADHIRRLLTEGSWSDIKHLTGVMRNVLGDITFQEAYNRTRRICNIPVSAPSVYELPRILNYVTAPNVLIWSAVAASCSVPLIFNAAPLLVKDPGTGQLLPWNPSPLSFIDGSVENDVPMQRLAIMFNINHFIVAQVNPHVVPFLSNDDHLSPTHHNRAGRQNLQSSHPSSEWLRNLTTMAKNEALHRLQFLTELRVFPNLCTKLRSVLSQIYAGDITILPDISLHDLPRVLKNPTPEFMLRNCLSGERATWPKLSRIRDRCAIELALDRAVHALRARVVFSESQVDLRRLVAGPGGIRSAMTPTWGIARTQPRTAAHGFAGHEHLGPPPYHYRRRGSGGSIQLLARQKRIQQGIEDSITDVETEEEEMFELSRNRSADNQVSESQYNNASPRLRRVAKSHHHLPMHDHFLSPTSTVGTGIEPLDPKLRIPIFDFASPMTPPEPQFSESELLPRELPFLSKDRDQGGGA